MRSLVAISRSLLSAFPNAKPSTSLLSAAKIIVTGCLLAACSETHMPGLPTESDTKTFDSGVLGIAEVRFNPEASSPAWQFKPISEHRQRYSTNPPLQFVRVVSAGQIQDASNYYVWSKIEYKNVQPDAFSNVTLYSLNRNGSNLGGTAFKDLVSANGTLLNQPETARLITGSHGMIDNDGLLKVSPQDADFQAFRTYESQSVQDALRLGNDIDADDKVLEYGYVLHDSSGDRTIDPGEAAFVTLAALIPKRSGITEIPTRWLGTFAMVLVPATRVTRGPAEPTLATVVRARSLMKTTEIVLLGVDKDTVSPEFKTIRIPGLETYQPEDRPEGTIDSQGGLIKLGQARVTVPAGAVTGTSFKLERLDRPPIPLPDDSVLPHATGSQLVSVFRVSASSDQFQLPVQITIPVSTLVSPRTPSRTELYLYDGKGYHTVRIEKNANGFDLNVKSLAGTAGASGFPAGIVLVAMRAPTSAVSDACAAKGGDFNGEYCQLPWDLPGQNAISDPTLKVLSFNVGNSLQSGPGNDPYYCGLYAHKLCSIAIENNVGKVLAAEKPDIVALQEVWNDRCEFIVDTGFDTSSEVGTTDYVTPAKFFVSHERVCDREAKFEIPRQIDRLLPPLYYDVQCSPVRRFNQGEPAQRLTNGYECIGIRRGILKFVAQPDPKLRVIQPACDAKLNPDVTDYAQYWKGSDTGFQVATVQLRNPKGPPAYIDVINAHMIAPDDSKCRRRQLEALYDRYFPKDKDNPASRRPAPRRFLLLGDMNTSPYFPAIGDSAKDYFNTIFTEYQQPDTMDVDVLITDTRMAYLLSDPSENTVYLGPLGFSYDHVLSNFAASTAFDPVSPCSRGDVVRGVDHLRTRCRLVGFDSVTYITVSVRLVKWDNVELPWGYAKAGSWKRGVPISYIKLSHPALDDTYTWTGAPDDVWINYNFEGCRNLKRKGTLHSAPAGEDESTEVSFLVDDFSDCIPP